MGRIVVMKPMIWWRHLLAYVTLGLLCGWYQFLLVLLPILLWGCWHRSTVAIVILLSLVVLSLTPLSHEPRMDFMNSWIWKIWHEYFDLTADNTTLRENLHKGQKYMFFEFPHGIFPMGQFLSASLIRDLAPGRMICGTGADIVFSVPVMRQLMSWLGTMPAKRDNITKILNKGYDCAIIPGGIAEIYLTNSTTESIFLKSRMGAVKAAIQEGAHIVPMFFFGNTKIFHVVGSSNSISLMARISRKIRASVVLFYGRHGLPVPIRHPIHIASGDIIKVKQIAKPTDAEIQDVMDQVVAAVQVLYNTRKPNWEDRELIIK